MQNNSKLLMLLTILVFLGNNLLCPPLVPVKPMTEEDFNGNIKGIVQFDTYGQTVNKANALSSKVHRPLINILERERENAIKTALAATTNEEVELFLSKDQGKLKLEIILALAKLNWAQIILFMQCTMLLATADTMAAQQACDSMGEILSDTYDPYCTIYGNFAIAPILVDQKKRKELTEKSYQSVAACAKLAILATLEIMQAEQALPIT